MTMRGFARRGGGSALEFLPDNKRMWFLSERDGWMHLYTLDVTADAARAEAADGGQVGGQPRRARRATARGST